MVTSDIPSAAGAGLMTTGDAPFVSGAATPISKPTWYSYYVLGLLVLVYMFSQVDRKLPLILIESVKHDLKLSDTQIGLATGIVFTLVYSVFGIPVSRVADRYGRKAVICWSLLVWSSITGLNGLATNFWQFAMARGGVAIGESGATPSAQSLLPDFFPPRRLAMAGGIFMAASPIGYLVAVAGGGMLNDLASWRVAMMVMAVPGLLLTVLAALTIREPKRAKAVVGEIPPLWTSLLILWRIKTFRYMNFAAMASGCAVGALGSFTPAYIMRHFGYTSGHTGVSYGLLAAAAGLFGCLSGGVVADRLGDRNVRAGLWYVAAIAALSAPASIGALFSPSYGLFLALMFIPEASITAWSGPSTPIVMTLVDPRMRALASSVYLFSFMGVGFSIGPVLAGAFSDLLRPTLHADSLKWALVGIASLRILTAIYYAIAASKLKGDLARAAAPAA
ncbi:MAG: transporter, family, hexuronate transporter [Phenylobacterium sp.]|jgi:MFS family permease|nr:transporter, family, hexuronate transporter [Phenylobacterium sp.]